MNINIEDLEELDPDELDKKFERRKKQIPKMKVNGRSVFEIQKIKNKKEDEQRAKSL